MTADTLHSDAATNPVSFETVFAAELRDVRRRRDDQARRDGASQQQVSDTAAGSSGQGKSQQEKKQPIEKAFGTLSGDGTFSRGHPQLNAIGLCLSGGGIRSASFCLGVMQALDKLNLLRHVDYLSTVSGGGYIGSSLSAGMSKNNGEFPFESKLDQDETPAVKHVRNYSNYLVPHGKKDVLESIVIYLRGIVANVILVLPWVLFAAYVIVRSNPTRAHLDQTDILSWRIPNIFPFHHFVITAYLALLLLVLFAIWSLIRSGRRQVDKPEVPSTLTTAYGISLAVLGIVAFLELQPFILKYVWASHVVSNVTGWVQRISVALAPVAGVVTFFWNQLQAFIKRAMDTPGTSSKLAAYSGKALTYVAAAVLPLALWALVFQLSWWGIAPCETATCRFPNEWTKTPGWLLTAAGALFGPAGLNRPAPIATFYLLCFVVLVAVSMFLRPNANSLHRLYRDRLSKAFIFDPRPIAPEPARFQRFRDWVNTRIFNAKPAPLPPEDLKPLDGLKLSELDASFAPFHLINTALNIQGSRHVNRRAGTPTSSCSAAITSAAKPRAT